MSAFQGTIEAVITAATGRPFRMAGRQEMGGGCINAACAVSGDDGRRFFIKYNERELLSAFREEANGLRAMAATRTIRVPGVLDVCQFDLKAGLVLEYLDIGPSRNRDWESMGAGLARMHRNTADRFGWPSDNFIGSTPQLNTWQTDWISFYADCRLRPQLDRARRDGLRLREADALLQALPGFFKDYLPVPSLLHGDLWSGNAAFLADGAPVIFDPACYYGDRETDLAMTGMFGGFPPAFYSAYHAVWPIDEGYTVRKHLYTLYHLLNHYNLFGGGYGAQAESTIAGLLTSVS